MVYGPPRVEIAQQVQRKAGRQHGPGGEEQKVVERIEILPIRGQRRDTVQEQDATVRNPLLIADDRLGPAAARRSRWRPSRASRARRSAGRAVASIAIGHSCLLNAFTGSTTLYSGNTPAIRTRRPDRQGRVRAVHPSVNLRWPCRRQATSGCRSLRLP